MRCINSRLTYLLTEDWIWQWHNLKTQDCGRILLQVLIHSDLILMYSISQQLL